MWNWTLVLKIWHALDRFSFPVRMKMRGQLSCMYLRSYAMNIAIWICMQNHLRYWFVLKTSERFTVPTFVVIRNTTGFELGTTFISHFLMSDKITTVSVFALTSVRLTGYMFYFLIIFTVSCRFRLAVRYSIMVL